MLANIWRNSWRETNGFCSCISHPDPLPHGPCTALVQTKTCCLTASGPYMNQYWRIIKSGFYWRAISLVSFNISIVKYILGLCTILRNHIFQVPMRQWSHYRTYAACSIYPGDSHCSNPQENLQTTWWPHSVSNGSACVRVLRHNVLSKRLTWSLHVFYVDLLDDNAICCCLALCTHAVFSPKMCITWNPMYCQTRCLFTHMVYLWYGHRKVGRASVFCVITQQCLTSTVV